MPDNSIEITTGPSPDAAVIWLHGLGADGNDFVPVVAELTPLLSLPDNKQVRFIFPHAPVRPVTCNGGYAMRAWYDIFSLENFEREDEAGFAEARQRIDGLINEQLQKGITADNIVLMGFSQGGAVALHSGLRYQRQLAGIGALSCYLPLRNSTASEASTTNQHTTLFMAHGRQDPVVRFVLGEQSRDILQQLGYPVQWQEYNMEHSVCTQEIRDIAQWLSHCLSPATDAPVRD
ncbi:MAG: carboxylesterase [Gammaproteobacteria bacterium]|nr:carboxylesterase [Gammaproteobacteria bacterium]